MASVTITNKSGVTLAVSSFGTLNPGQSKTVPLTGSRLEAVQAELTTLIQNGTITINVTADDAVDDRVELATRSANTGFVGPFAEALAASQTNNVVNFGGAAMGWVAPRAGSIVGFSAAVSAAVTTADANCRVAINGTAVAATQLDFNHTAANTKDYATFDVDAVSFNAGDVVTVVYTSAGIGNTPTLVATIEVAV